MPYLKQLAREIHLNAVHKGFYESLDVSNSLMWKQASIARIHSELPECVEAIRGGNKPSEHIPLFTGEAEEMADVIIRVLDYCCAFGIDIDSAVAAKMEFNKGRVKLHGKNS
jgi:NTP pyrophosphatase (non-canonical NTP hydrolase)